MYQYLSTWSAFLAYAAYCLQNEKAAYILYPLTTSVLFIGLLITNYYMNVPLSTSIFLDLAIHILPFLLIRSMKKEPVPFKYVLAFYIAFVIVYNATFRLDVMKNYKNTPWYIIYILFPFTLICCCLNCK